MTTALICGVTGQDGAYLARALIKEGITVLGTTRDVQRADRTRLEHLGVADRIELLALDPLDRLAVKGMVAESGVVQIYALWGQSSVGVSFERPAETVDSIVPATLNLLEAVRGACREVRLFHAGSSECFGDMRGVKATESTPYRPASPYGAAKAAAQLLVATYRTSFGLFAANGILFNHESPLRPPHFVTRKIARAVARIAAGSDEQLQLGRIDIARDWGWAPEYVDAMRLMLQQDTAADYVLATGETSRLDQFLAAAFESVGLQWRDHVTSDSSRTRPNDPDWIGARPNQAACKLGWRAHTRMAEVAQRMVAAERV